MPPLPVSSLTVTIPISDEFYNKLQKYHRSLKTIPFQAWLEQVFRDCLEDFLRIEYLSSKSDFDAWLNRP